LRLCGGGRRPLLAPPALYLRLLLLYQLLYLLRLLLLERLLRLGVREVHHVLPRLLVLRQVCARVL